MLKDLAFDSVGKDDKSIGITQTSFSLRRYWPNIRSQIVHIKFFRFSPLIILVPLVRIYRFAKDSRAK